MWVTLEVAKELWVWKGGFFIDPSLILHFDQDKVQDKDQNDKPKKDNLLNERLSSIVRSFNTFPVRG